jgi:hypothetical protein
LVASSPSLLKQFKQFVYVLPVNGHEDIEESLCLQKALANKDLK